MRRRVMKLLEDVRHSVSRIEHYIEGKALPDYLANSMLRDAIERRFEIIGEALRQLRQVAPEVAEGIPDLNAIIGFRNPIAHQYDDLRDAQVWETVWRDVPALAACIQLLMDQERQRP